MRCFIAYLFAISFLSMDAQSFPYLNASSGNYGEFPVDQDTNIYLFHGSRLVKTDKNFNTIWANYYSGITFSNLLLCKTGSMFFLSGRTVGKIENNGTLSWCLDLASISATVCNSILLDHNNELAITGRCSSTAFFAKVDTNGVPVKFAQFNGSLVENLHLNYDSAGYYHFVATGITGLDWNDGIGTSVFNDGGNSFFGTGRYFFPSGNNVYWTKWRMLRSRFNNNFYIYLQQINYNNYFLYSGLVKSNKDGYPQWRIDLRNYNGVTGNNVYSHGANECENGDILFQLETCCSYTGAFGSGVLKIDQNGAINSSYQIYASATTTNHLITSHAPQNIFSGKSYMHLVAPTYPDNPLTIGKFDLNNPSSCNLSASYNSTINPSAISNTHPTGSVIASGTFTPIAFSVTVTSVPFGINSSSCTITDLHDPDQNHFHLNIFPNPASTQLSIQNLHYENLTVTDIFGKVVLEERENESKVNIRSLAPGLYFITLKNRENIYTSKFIKE